LSKSISEFFFFRTKVANLIPRSAAIAAHPMVWDTVAAGTLPTLMKIVDDHVTCYQDKLEALKKDEGGGGGLKNAPRRGRRQSMRREGGCFREG